jgi:hypothetical protein
VGRRHFEAELVLPGRRPLRRTLGQSHTTHQHNTINCYVSVQ